MLYIKHKSICISGITITFLVKDCWMDALAIITIKRTTRLKNSTAKQKTTLIAQSLLFGSIVFSCRFGESFFTTVVRMFVSNDFLKLAFGLKIFSPIISYSANISYYFTFDGNHSSTVGAIFHILNFNN